MKHNILRRDVRFWPIAAILPPPSDNPRMLRKLLKLVFWLGLVGLVLLAAAGYGLHRWLGTDDFRARVEREASARLGLTVRLAALKVAAWPVPAVAVEGLVVAAPGAHSMTGAVTLARIDLRPDWVSTVSGRPAVATLVLRDAVLPLDVVSAIATAAGQRLGAGRAPASGEGAMDLSWLPRRTVLDGVTLVGADGTRMRLDAQARLGADGWPRQVEASITDGRLAGSKLALVPGDQTPDLRRWTLKLEVGGGTVQGPLTVKFAPAASGASAGGVGAGGAGGASGPRRAQVSGELHTQGVEVSALTAPRRPLSGRVEADTTLSASVTRLQALPDALQSQTRFAVRGARVYGVDLARAVQTVGLSRGGETAFDTLAGQLSTQGRTVHLTQLVASSGLITARGDVTVSPSRALAGRVTVDLARGATGGLVGVPLVVGGTLDAPEVTLTRGAMLGAAVGTALLPGVGTGAGAKLGDRIGEGLKGLFGGGK